MVVKYVVAACAGVLLATSPACAESATLAEVISSEPNEAGVNVTVPTGGCTSKADFEVNARPAAGGVTDIEIRRLKPDRCKGNFPAGIKLQFTWGDLKVPAGTKLAVKNPVEARTTVLTKHASPVVKPVKKKPVKRCLRSKHRKHGCTKHALKRHVRRAKLRTMRAYHHGRRHHHHRRAHRHHWCF